MERLWAVLVAVAALVGCRTAQPTTNPFMRTTVPPPATGSAVVVTPMTPGQPATPGVLGPITSSTTPPPVSPAVPVAPPVSTPPPIVAPPVTPPPRDKFSPPGGSFQYNQSSLERSKSDAPEDAALAQQIADTLQTSMESSTDDTSLSSPGHAVRQAVFVETDLSSLLAAHYHEPADTNSDKTAEATKTMAPDERVEPPESLTLAEAVPHASDHEIRILKSSSNEDDKARTLAPSRPSTNRAPVFRIVAGQETSPNQAVDNPFFRKVAPDANASGPSRAEAAVKNTVTFHAAAVAATADSHAEQNDE